MLFLADLEKRLGLYFYLSIILRDTHLLALILVLNQLAQCLQSLGSRVHVLIAVVRAFSIATTIPAAKHVIFD